MNCVWSNNVWNSDDIKKIDKIILNRACLTESLNYKRTKREKVGEFVEFAQKEIEVELLKLLYTNNKLEISRIFDIINKTEYDKDQDQPRLIKCLNKINTNDYTQIFVIFREILLQFELTIVEVVKEMFFENRNDDMINEIITRITSGFVTKEELKAKAKLEKIYNNTNGVTESYLFKPLVEICNNNIKKKLLMEIKKNLNNQVTKTYEKRYSKK